MRRLAAALAMACWFAGSAASAQSTHVVVLVEGRASLGRRVVGEVGGMGFDVEVIDESTPSSPFALVDVARRHEALAAVVLRESEPSAFEVWVADRATGKTVLRRVVSPDEAEIALAAAELLRASLLELAIAPGTGELEAPSAANVVVEDALTPPRSSWALAVRGGLLAHLDGPLAPRLGLALVAPLAPSLEFDVGLGLAPLASIGLGDARADVHVATLGAGLRLDAHVGGPVHVLVGIDAALVGVLAVGQPVDSPTSRVVGTAAASLGLDAALRIGLDGDDARGLSLEVGVDGGLYVPAVEVGLRDVVAGRLGAPWLGASAGLLVPLA